MRDLPTRGLVRGARLAAVPATFVGRRAVGLGRRVHDWPAEVIAAEVQARTAEQLFAVLGELKGGAMKAGQWLSAMEAAMPKPLAGPYGEALTRLQEAAPAMPMRSVHQVLTDSFGRDWRDRFAEFDDRPSAAAGIGQVHRGLAGRSAGRGEGSVPRRRGGTRRRPAAAGPARPAAPGSPHPGLDARGLFAELRTGHGRGRLPAGGYRADSVRRSAP